MNRHKKVGSKEKLKEREERKEERSWSNDF